MGFCCFFFFFSSRRRHTRSLRDWSSDVCSSDLCSAWAASPGGCPAAPSPPRAGCSSRAPCSSPARSEEHTSELQSRRDLVCRLLLEKKKKQTITQYYEVNTKPNKY